MNPYGEHAAGLDELTDELGDACPTFAWPAGNPNPSNCKEYKILPGSIRQAGDNSPGGLMMDADLSFTATLAQFGNGPFPKSNQQISYPGRSGKLLRIVSTDMAPGSFQMTIAANDAAQSL